MTQGLPMNVRELTDEDVVALAGAETPLCGWGGCDRDARWEVICEDLLDIDDLAHQELGFQVESGNKSIPFSELVATKHIGSYCDEHAREFCMKGNIEFPVKLAG